MSSRHPRNTRTSDRRSFLKRASVVGATGIVAFDALLGLASAEAEPAHHSDSDDGVTKGDFDILLAAQIAEALAVTTYRSIVEFSPFLQRFAERRSRLHRCGA